MGSAGASGLAVVAAKEVSTRVKSMAEQPSDHPLLLVANAALEAGIAALHEIDSRAVVRTKSSPTDPVTATDRAVEQAISEVIRTLRPHDELVGEEYGTSGEAGRVRWLIDPIDGTVNFTYQIPYAAISIAAVDDAGSVVGVVWDLGTEERFVAVRGEGAWLDGELLSMWRSETPPLAEALVGTGFAYDAKVRKVQGRVLGSLMGAVRDIRRFGAAALDLCWCAAGRLDAYFETGLKPWDHAAATLVVSEAGGLVRTDLPGIGDDLLTVAGPPGLFEELQAAVSAALAAASGDEPDART